MSVPAAAAEPVAASPLSARVAAFVGAGTLVLNTATFLVYFGIARLATHETYGDILALLSVVFIGYVPAVVASLTVARRIALVAAQAGPAATARIEREVLRRTYAVALAVLAAGVVARAPVAALLHVADPGAVGWAAAALAISIVFQIQRGMIQGLERYRGLALSYALEGAGRFVFGLLGTALAGESGFFAGIALALGAVALFNGIELVRHRSAAGTSGAAAASEDARASAATALAMAVVTVLSLYDAILVKHWFAPETAGLYAAAAVVGRATYSMVAVIPAILLPRVVHLTSGGRSTARVLGASIAATAAPMLLATAAVALLPHLVMAVVAGRSFDAATAYAFPLSLAAGTLALANLGTTYLVARRRFAVVPWLLAAGLAEIAWVSLAHGSLGAVAWAVCAGHAATLVVSGAALLASRERPRGRE
ncbi:MAG: hypothetical protein QOI11_3903 [Candidatus Eremiobacteraeota bacterium]|nr:hypothetical protein [Candidatus Eremiobacteraeota bacterium]